MVDVVGCRLFLFEKREYICVAQFGLVSLLRPLLQGEIGIFGMGQVWSSYQPAESHLPLSYSFFIIVFYVGEKVGKYENA